MSKQKSLTFLTWLFNSYIATFPHCVSSPLTHLKHGGRGPTPWNEQKQLRCHAFLCRASANWCESIHSAKSATNIIWLVVYLPYPSEKWWSEWVRQLGWWHDMDDIPYEIPTWTILIIPIKNMDDIPKKYMESQQTFHGSNGSLMVPVTTQSWRLSARWLMNRPGPYRGTSWFHWNSWSLHLPPVRTGLCVSNSHRSTCGTEKSHFWNEKHEENYGIRIILEEISCLN